MPGDKPVIEPPEAARQDVWIILRRCTMISLLAAGMAVILIFLMYLAFPEVRVFIDPFMQRAMMQNQLTEWCQHQTNIPGIPDNKQDCSTWARQLVDSNPPVIRKCAPLSVDSEAFLGCYYQNRDRLP